MTKNFSKAACAVSILAVVLAGLFLFPGLAVGQDGQLLSADYGARDNRVDVTYRVQSLARNGILNFRVSNDALGGDPAPHQAKELLIRLQTPDGRIRDYRFREGDVVELTLSSGSYDSAGDDDRRGRRLGHLHIIRARYGAGDSWNDVTDALQRRVDDDRLSLKVNDTNMGGDPAEDQRKELHVEWEYRGQQHDTRLQEGDSLELPGNLGNDDSDDWNLRIVRAQYGTGDRWLDVTATLQGLIRNNSLNIKVNNTNMGADPAEDQHKELRVTWAYRGRQQETVLREGDYLNLPGATGNGDSDDRAGYNDLRIIRARYGAGNRWLDVTQTLQNLVADNRLHAKVNNTNMGADPAEDQHKELIIEWEYQGQRQKSRLREGDYINIP